MEEKLVHEVTPGHGQPCLPDRSSRSEMSAGRASFVVASAGAGGALLLVALWATKTRAPATALPAASVEAASPTDSGSAEIPELEGGRELPSIPDPEPAVVVQAEAAVATETPDSVQAEPPDGSLEAVLKMLGEPAFLDACAEPSEADPEVLTDLVARARRVFSSYQTEECARRVEAGLYERMEGYKPGEPFTVQGPKRGGELVSHSSDGSEFRRVVYSTKEYPHLYALRDQIYLLEGELSSRNRSGSR